MSSERILGGLPKGFSNGSSAIAHYRKNSARNLKKDTGYLYQCVFALEQAILNGSGVSMSAETMDQLADLQKQIDVLADVVQKLVEEKTAKPADKKPARKKTATKKAK